MLTSGKKNENKIATAYITGDIKNNFCASDFTSAGNSLVSNVRLRMPYFH